MDTQIFIATHKKFNEPRKEGYFPLYVGANGKCIGDYLRDDEGENISDKNSHYCELTGLFWMWKNINTKNVGLVHYRRYFSTVENYKELISIEEVEELLLNYDMIVPNPKTYNVSNKCQYWMTHYLSDLMKVKNICHNLFPDYDEAFEWFLKQKSMYAYNMFIGKKELVDDYFSWLFTILFELDKTTSFVEYSDYQSRLFGFLSERLFNVWLKRNSIKIVELPIFNSENLEASYIEDTYHVSYWGMVKHFLTQITGLTRR